MITGRFFATGADRRIIFAIAVLLTAAIVVPLLNLAASPESSLYVPPYIIALTGKYLCYALLALALDLVWGFCSILSLGHGAFFALGGYAMGMYLMRQIGSRGVYGNPILPDFMVFLNYKQLPWFWYGFDHFWFAAIMVMLAPGLLAFVFGWFAFRSRVTGVYLSIITQAMTYALLLAFFRNDMGFGGNNGLTDFKEILGFNVQADATRSALFAASAVALALGVFITWKIVGSKYGKLLMAVRDAESRTRFLGWRAENVKLFAFTVSAVMAGIAGALYVPQVGIINPGEFEPANSIEVVVWTAVGGRATIVGPIIGAILVNVGKSWFTGAFPEFWLFALGGLFVASTLFLPRGILGVLDGASASGRVRTTGSVLGVVVAWAGWQWFGDTMPAYALLIVGIAGIIVCLLSPSRVLAWLRRSKGTPNRDGEPPMSAVAPAIAVRAATRSGEWPASTAPEPQPAE